MIRLREGTAADAAALAALFTASVQQLGASHYTPEQRTAWTGPAPDIEAWRQRLAALSVLVAERDGEVAGFIGFEADGYVDLLFTAPAHARRGVASALLDAAEARLRAAGVARMDTHASLVARPVFERHGFAVVARETVVRAGIGLDRFVMRKALAGG